jgi:hypothetical protein
MTYKTQQMVIAIEITSFQSKVQKLLDSGWIVVPGTIAISSSVNGERHQYTSEKYIAVLEKQQSEP